MVSSVCSFWALCTFLIMTNNFTSKIRCTSPAGVNLNAFNAHIDVRLLGHLNKTVDIA